MLRKECFDNRCKDAIERKSYIRLKSIKDPNDAYIEIYKNLKK